jgi:hypothetical protein
VKSVIACSFKTPPKCQPLPLLRKEGLLRLPLPSTNYLLLPIYHPPFILILLTLYSHSVHRLRCVQPLLPFPPSTPVRSLDASYLDLLVITYSARSVWTLFEQPFTSGNSEWARYITYIHGRDTRTGSPRLSGSLNSFRSFQSAMAEYVPIIAYAIGYDDW